MSHDDHIRNVLLVLMWRFNSTDLGKKICIICTVGLLLHILKYFYTADDLHHTNPSLICNSFRVFHQNDIDLILINQSINQFLLITC